MGTEIRWSWSDALILVAIQLADDGDGAQLHRVIAAADAINHAIPTTNELNHAIRKLTECGVIVVEQGFFSVANAHREPLETATRRSGGLFSMVDAGLKWLQSHGLTKHSVAPTALTDADVESAYRKYVGPTRKRKT